MEISVELFTGMDVRHVNTILEAITVDLFASGVVAGGPEQGAEPDGT